MEKRTPKEKTITLFIKEVSAGCVVFKYDKKALQWLITKSSPSALFPKSYWRLPKGWLDDDDIGTKPGLLARGERKATEDEIQKAAVREVAEEGGVKVEILKKIGTEKLFFMREGNKILKLVTFYLAKWVSDLPQGPGFETSETAWLPYTGAKEKLKYPAEKKILEKAYEILTSGLQENLI